MSTATTGMTTAAVPDLTFAVTAAEPEPHAAVPTLRFAVDVVRSGGGPVRAVALTTTVLIDVARRRYDPRAHRLLNELFGLPEEWSRGMRPLTWARTTTQVPPFADGTRVGLPVPCGTDTELAVAKYLRAVGDGDIPLTFLFNGTVFFQAEEQGPAGHLRTAQLSWSKETAYLLPAALWHDLVERYHGGSPWLRLPRETYDRLDAYRARHVLASPDAAVRSLLDRSGAP